MLTILNQNDMVNNKRWDRTCYRQPRRLVFMRDNKRCKRNAYCQHMNTYSVGWTISGVTEQNDTIQHLKEPELG